MSWQVDKTSRSGQTLSISLTYSENMNHGFVNRGQGWERPRQLGKLEDFIHQAGVKL